MKLSGKNGDMFELTLIGYQFPHSSTNDWDANWFMVRTRAAIAGREWSSDDPAMLTWEVEQLANWLESLSSNHGVDAQLDFIEPNLSFQWVDRSTETTRLQVPATGVEAPFEVMVRTRGESRRPDARLLFERAPCFFQESKGTVKQISYASTPPEGKRDSFANDQRRFS